MSGERKVSPKPRLIAMVANYVGGQGKTLLTTAIVDLHWLHDRPMVVVQIDDQERLARTIGQDVVTVDTQTIRASRSNPAAGVQAFRPLMSALEQAVTDDAAAGIDVGATQITGVAAFASLSDLDGELREMGFEGYAFVPAVAAPEAIAQARRTIGMLAQSLPILRPVLVENRRDGNFNSLAAGSEANRALLRLRAAYPSLPEIVMPAIEAGSWRHFEPHFCRPIVVASMDIAEVMRLTGLPKAEAKIAKGDVAAWVAEMERALAPLLGLPEVFR